MIGPDAGRWTFHAAGTSGTFNVNAPVYDASAIALYAVSAAGAIYAPTATVEVATDRSGAVVTVASGLTFGDKVVVYRVPKLTQLEPLPASGPLPSKLVGRQLDRAFADLVALAIRSGRSIRAPLADNDELGELPIATQRAGKFVAFDAEGALTVLSSVPLSPAVNVSAFMQGLLLAASAGATLTSLGLSSYFQTLIDETDAAGLAAAIGAEAFRDALDVERANTMAIQGLTYSKNGANTIDIAAGGAMSSDGAFYMDYAGGTALDITALFAAGGLLDTGSIGNSPYYLFLVRNPTSGLVRPLISLSPTVGTMPSGYTQKRLIGYLKRTGGSLVDFYTWELSGGGLAFRWTSPTNDVVAPNALTDARRLDALKVPLDFAVDSIARYEVFDGTNAAIGRVCCPSEADPGSPAAGTAPLNNLFSAPTVYGVPELRIRTDSSGRVASRAAGPTTVDTYNIATVGFDWARRN